MRLDKTYLALQVASQSDSRDAWMWAATHPEAGEDILINVAKQKNAAKIKAQVAAHRNATEKVIDTIGKSYSPYIWLEIFKNKNLPDHVKNVWAHNRRAIYNAWHGGYLMNCEIHELSEPWKSIICAEIEYQKETGYRPPGRGRKTGWWKWKRR